MIIILETKIKITILLVIVICLNINSQEKILTGSNGKSDFVYKNGRIGIGSNTPEQGKSPDTDRKLFVNGGITLKKGGKLSYDPSYYVHAYSEFNDKIPEARFYNFGYYGHSWATRIGTAMVIKGNNNMVGIGTNNPEQGKSPDTDRKLFVNGGVTLKKGSKLSYDPSYYVHAYSEFNDKIPEARFYNFGHYGHSWATRIGTAMVIKGNNNMVGIGTNNPTARLSVNGKIHAKEVKINLGLSDWADYVFDEKYDLPSLNEVEKYIKLKGHLKDIPSTEEVAKNGIYLGEMNSKLLQKIEELTLYTIQQQKKINKLEQENESLKILATKLQKLQERLEKLENR